MAEYLTKLQIYFTFHPSKSFNVLNKHLCRLLREIVSSIEYMRMLLPQLLTVFVLLTNWCVLLPCLSYLMGIIIFSMCHRNYKFIICSKLNDCRQHLCLLGGAIAAVCFIYYFNFPYSFATNQNFSMQLLQSVYREVRHVIGTVKLMNAL